ncbi:MAG: type VI secretion protein IcmF/TssM N-terminal domain-containing protein [Isosphaeraceae bacterium]
MLRILAKPWEFLVSLFYLAFPMARAGRAGAGTAGVWAARLVLLGAALAGLTALNQWDALGLRRWISYGRISGYWLPAVGLCLYLIIWLGWWLYRLLNLEVPVEAAEFPDIDRAWKQACEALDRQGIRLDSTPLFLILGGTASGDEALFQAAALKAQVKQVPKDPDEPLHVTANTDGIWVSCPGTSVLGQQLLAADGPAAGAGGVSLETLSGESADAFKTMGMGAGETLRVEDFMASLKKAQAQARSPSASRSRSSVDVEKYTARLRYLCHLIARDRGGLCPINGMLVILPITLADPGNPVAEVCAASKTDLSEAFDALRMRCPVLFLVSDLDRLDGFSDLIERLPSSQRNNRMGQRFPLVPDLDPEDVPAKVKESIAWIGDSLFPTMVNSLFQVEARGEDANEVTWANSQLFRFLVASHDRRDRLAQLVTDSIPELPDEPILYRGCYLAGTGPDPATDQAFAPGVLMLLIKQQDSVSWTAAALRQDESFSRLARGLKTFFLLAIGLGVLAILGLIASRFLR